MSYRTIEIVWMPRSKLEWSTFTASRKESARLWSDLVIRHHRVRCLNWKWPSKGRWQRWAKQKYPDLAAQSVQQVIGEFCEAVQSTTELRKNGYEEARYPWRKLKYRDVIYTNQSARIRGGRLILPNGKSGYLRIPLSVPLPGRMMEVRAMMGRVLIVCEIPDEVRPRQTTIGIDLGVNTLLAATDGQKVVLVSGREVKATVQWRNKNLASISSAQSNKTKGSKQWKRLQRRKAKMLAKAARRIKDITHKATRKVVDAFPNATCYVGKPFNDAARKMGRKQAQQVSAACNRKIIMQLDYKSSGAIEVDEAYTSRTCPNCGERNKCRRVYCCRACGLTAPRDAVGCTNIRTVGMSGQLQTGCNVPNVVRWIYPSKYPACKQVVRLDTADIAHSYG